MVAAIGSKHILFSEVLQSISPLFNTSEHTIRNQIDEKT